MINGLSRGLTTTMRKPASMLILLFEEVGSNVVGGMCPALVVGPGVQISSFWKQERG